MFRNPYWYDGIILTVLALSVAFFVYAAIFQPELLDTPPTVLKFW